MATIRQCPTCGKPIEVNAPREICPQCLMKGAFPSVGGDLPTFVAPSPEELARHFPSLEILECIGQGGMGAVYKSRQKELDRIVALKILPEGHHGEPGFERRFTHEARALARLNHPNIVTLYEFGRAEGLFYFLMEYVDGVSLQHLLKSGRLAPEQALSIVPQICDALQFAHSRGIVHRDIKPGNLLLGRNGEVKIADFGIAKVVVGDPATPEAATTSRGNNGLTAVGAVIGTPAYMAPEQAQRPLEVDHRADIYSLGVVFYQMLTGELPAGKLDLPSRKVSVDARLDDVVLRALEREPDRRYQDATTFKTEIETIVRDAVAKPLAQSRRLLMILVAAIFVVAALVSVDLAFRARRNGNAGAALTLLDTSPPVVVQTTPISGSLNVEPGEFKIRVRFSKRMADGGWSWCSAWDNSTPMEGKPYFERDGRTCVLPVTLEAGRTYGFWLNSGKFKDFTDSDGRPAIPYLLIFKTQTQNSDH